MPSRLAAAGTPMWSNSTAGRILRAELARNCQVNVLAALDRREIDPFDLCVGALALGAEENGRNAGRGEHRGVGPERGADDLRLTGVAEHHLYNRFLLGYLERLAHEGRPHLAIVAVQHLSDLFLDEGRRLPRHRASLELEETALRIRGELLAPFDQRGVQRAAPQQAVGRVRAKRLIERAQPGENPAHAD